MHCCFLGTSRPGVKTCGKSHRCPILFTFYDTVPCDLSDLREHQRMDSYLLNVYVSFEFLEWTWCPSSPNGTGAGTVLEAVGFLIFIACFRQ